MDYSIALGNGTNPSTPLNGCEINCTLLLCLKYKSSYVLRSVSVHWTYKKCSYRESFFNIQCNDSMFEFLFVMLNQKLGFSFLESFIYNKNRCFFPFFRSFNSHSGL